MEYHFKTHKSSDGYWAECIELEGCSTQGDTKEELRENMFECLNLYLDEAPSSDVVFPLPKKKIEGNNIEKVKVQPAIAFSYNLRRVRLKHKMTQKQVAERMGLKNIYSYQRLESSGKANPALQTLVQVKEVFPELKLDAVF